MEISSGMLGYKEKLLTDSTEICALNLTQIS